MGFFPWTKIKLKKNLSVITKIRSCFTTPLYTGINDFFKNQRVWLEIIFVHNRWSLAPTESWRCNITSTKGDHEFARDMIFLKQPLKLSPTHITSCWNTVHMRINITTAAIWHLRSVKQTKKKKHGKRRKHRNFEGVLCNWCSKRGPEVRLTSVRLEQTWLPRAFAFITCSPYLSSYLRPLTFLRVLPV